jgi:hypothetical protein
MKTLYLEFPRLVLSLTVPEELVTDFREEFACVIGDPIPLVIHQKFTVHFEGKRLSLFKDRVQLNLFSNVYELIFALEEEIEHALVKNIGTWVAFHAGCVAKQDSAIMVVGNPDTGKTTTTFQMLELGLDFLCEEVTPVDPESGLVYPFPQILTMSRPYAEESNSLFPVKEGVLSYYGPELARYIPGRVRKKAAKLKTIIFPSYNPVFKSSIKELSPGDILTDLLHCCFLPNVKEEELYDQVIRISENCRLLRILTCGIASTRDLLVQITSMD